MIRFKPEQFSSAAAASPEAPTVPRHIWIAIHARIRHGYYDRPQVEAAIIDRLLPEIQRQDDDAQDHSASS